MGGTKLYRWNNPVADPFNIENTTKSLYWPIQQWDLANILPVLGNEGERHDEHDININSLWLSVQPWLQLYLLGAWGKCWQAWSSPNCFTGFFSPPELPLSCCCYYCCCTPLSNMMLTDVWIRPLLNACCQSIYVCYQLFACFPPREEKGVMDIKYIWYFMKRNPHK